MTNQPKNLDFLLNHFSEPLFPRTIFTHQRPYQFTVASKQEMFHYFENTGWIDCKINAFPSLKSYVNTSIVASCKIFMIALPCFLL
jgi:hypothetical protein